MPKGPLPIPRTGSERCGLLPSGPPQIDPASRTQIRRLHCSHCHFDVTVTAKRGSPKPSIIRRARLYACKMLFPTQGNEE